MKLILTFICFFCFVLNYSQESTTVSRVKFMAIYPGCENVQDSKMKSVQCFSQKLGNDVLKFLDTAYPISAESIDKDQLMVQIQFVVSEQGELTDFDIKRGDLILKKQALEAYRNLSRHMTENGIKIIPAKLDDGTAVPLIFNTSLGLGNPMDKLEREKEKKKLGIRSF